MKKILLVAVILVVLASVGVVFWSISTGNAFTAGAPAKISAKAAESLQAKIDAVKKKHESGTDGAPDHLELSEEELEAYVVHSLREKIPVQLDSIDVKLEPGSIASDNQLTFSSNSTGNPLVDALVGGTHNLFVKGRLAGDQGRGKFDLEEIRVDGIPVPKILVETLFDKYVKPKYPDADLKAPFDLPWGIEQLTIVQGKATVVY